MSVNWQCNWTSSRLVKSGGIDRRNADPKDEMTSLHCPSYDKQGNVFLVYENGQAKLKGEHPRLYINKPDSTPIWNNVEMVCYAKFVKPIIQSGSYTVFRLAARSNHQGEYKCVCNGKGYCTELMINQKNLTVKDGRFRKELIHPHYANKVYDIPDISIGNKWIGLKFICKTDSNNNVLLQTYLDTTDAGAWKKVGELVDKGDWKIDSAKELDNIEKDCAKCGSGCLDPAPKKPYSEKITRPGASCYLRTDFVQEAYFKKFSIKSI